MKIKVYIENLKYLLEIVISNMKGIIILNLFYSVITGLTPLLILQLTKKIMEIVELEFSYDNKIRILSILLILILIIKLIQNLFSYVNSYLDYINTTIFTMKFDLKVFHKLKRVKFQYYDMLSFNELCDKLYSGSNSNCNILIGKLFNLMQSLIIFISYITTLIFVNIPHWQKLIVFLSSVFALVVRRYYYNKQNDSTIKNFEETNLLNRKARMFNQLFFETAVQDELRTYNSQHYFIKIIEESNSEIYKKNKNSKYRIHNYNRAGAIGVFLLLRTVYILFLYDIFVGIINYSEFVLIVGILEGLFAEIVKINFDFGFLWENLHYIGYVKEFDELEEIKIEKSNLVLANIELIEFVDVYFKYPESNKYVLEGINFKIYKGQTIGIIGLNGSGKSTILKLLMRLYDVEKGKVLINGVDIKEYDTDSLYNQFSVVFQDFCRYSLTIREFIMLSDRVTEENIEKLRKVLKLLQLDSLIDRLPQGIDTLLTKDFADDSIDLSMGQWQKLAIARACYSDKPVIVLDEPSSFLDVISEKEIFDMIYNVFSNKTIIFISHNLSNTSICDNIILINDGSIASQGNHNELLSKNGLYRKLYFSQASRYLQLNHNLSKGDQI
jgi:ABC-type multidrug transport system fused ATPase/permease subunit